MSKRGVIALIIVNLLICVVAAYLFLRITSVRSFGDPRPRDVDALAAKMAANPNQAAIAEILHRDDLRLHTLLEIYHAQRSALYAYSIMLGAFAIANVLLLFGLSRKHLQR